MSTDTHRKTFNRRLDDAITRNDTLLCVGLDPDLARFPESLSHIDPARAIIQFNREIIEATHDLVCAYKPNFGFFIAHGLAGVEALLATRELVPPHIPVILDCKIGDINSTAAAYARGFFDRWNFDAITINPLLGRDSLDSIFEYTDRGFFLLCKTSNPGSGDFQDRTICFEDSKRPLYRVIARSVTEWDGTTDASLGLVVGATYPDELAAVREDCPDLPILVPGIGTQQGDLRAALLAGLDRRGRGLLINSSRRILYRSSGQDFAARARQEADSLREQINRERKELVEQRT